MSDYTDDGEGRGPLGTDPVVDKIDELPPDEEMPEPIATSIGLTDVQVVELSQPLDRTKIKVRQGKFSYIETHHAIRTCNRIFGFGNWGTRIVDLTEIGMVAVTNGKEGTEKREGWEVAYRCTLELTVRDCMPTSGVGFGNGQEYSGDVARLRACELAVKEAESDALKRALRAYGDQFGLILYAKDGERAAIEREARGEPAPVFRDTRAPQTPVPSTWAGIQDLVSKVGAGGPAQVEDFMEYVLQATDVLFQTRDSAKLSQEQKATVRQKASGAAVNLSDAVTRDAPPVTRAEMTKAFGSVMDGFALPGPEWAMDATETERPSRVSAAVEKARQAQAGGSPPQEAPPEATGAPVADPSAQDGATGVPAGSIDLGAVKAATEASGEEAKEGAKTNG